ncbi:MAG: cytidylate kinase-like family protein [Anaerolineae bacterium]|nr:cytidylate kinase-like family protein [Anaerolineae bacterium]
MSIITISRQLGSRGSYIAAEVAKRLQLRYIDRQVLQRAAEIVGYPDEEMVQQLEQQEQVPGWLERIIGTINTMPPIPMIPSATLREGYLYDEHIAMLMVQEGLNRTEAQEQIIEQSRRADACEDYAKLVEKVILEYARKDNVIIVGRGGQVILKNMPNTLHIQVVAPVELRTLWLMERLGTTQKETEQQIQQSDKQRARYMKHYHDVNWLDTKHYHIVINTGKTSTKLATDIICEATAGIQKGTGL